MPCAADSAMAWPLVCPNAILMMAIVARIQGAETGDAHSVVFQLRIVKHLSCLTALHTIIRRCLRSCWQKLRECASAARRRLQTRALGACTHVPLMRLLPLRRRRPTQAKMPPPMQPLALACAVQESERHGRRQHRATVAAVQCATAVPRRQRVPRVIARGSPRPRAGVHRGPARQRASAP